MNTQKFSIVTAASASDISFAVNYVRTIENWGLNADDDELFSVVAPGRCYYGKLGDEKISYIQTATYGNEEFCFIGVYIVKKEYRHKGYGKLTWDYAMSKLPDTCLLSLSAVLTQEANYMKSGFKTAWKEFSYSFDAQKVASLPVSTRSSVKILQMKDADFSSLLKYDTHAFCYSRELYLRKMLQDPNTESWVAVNEVGNIVGFVVARYTLETYGWFLVPLIADDVSIARSLIAEVANFLVENPVQKKFSMTIPAINENSMAFAKEFSEDLIFESLRMFAGTPPNKMVENSAKIMFSVNYVLG